MRPGGWPLGKTPSWSSHPSVWTETATETGAGGLLLAVLQQRAKHSEECLCVRGEQRDQLLLLQVQREHVGGVGTVLTGWQGCGWSAMASAASWPGWRRSGSWCGQWRYQRRYRAAPSTDCWLTGSASMGAARSVTTTWLARTGTTVGTPGGLPASLPGRLTESAVWSEDSS